jgi:hypothetical protein
MQRKASTGGNKGKNTQGKGPPNDIVKINQSLLPMLVQGQMKL